MTRSTARFSLLVAALAVVACQSPTDSTTNPSATIVPVATTLELPIGGSGFIVFEVQRARGHDKAVQMSVASVPTGIFAAFHPPTVTTLVNYSSFTVAISESVKPGTYTIDTRMTADWLETRSIPVTVHVAQPTLQLSTPVSVVSVEQTRSVTIPLTISRGGFLTGPVTLTVRDLPPGLTGTLNPNTIPAGENHATLTITSTLETPVTTATAKVRAIAPAVQDSLPLTIAVEPTTTPAVTLAAVPAVISVPAETQSSVQIVATRHAGYAGNLTYEVTGSPGTVISQISSTSARGDTATLLLNALTGAPNGSYHLTVRANGSGIAPTSTVVTLHVVARP